MYELPGDYSQGVSVVVPYARLQNMNNIFDNYMQQEISKKGTALKYTLLIRRIFAIYGMKARATIPGK